MFRNPFGPCGGFLPILVSLLVCWSSEIRVNVCPRDLRGISTRSDDKEGKQEAPDEPIWALFFDISMQETRKRLVWTLRDRDASAETPFTQHV
jgi:hypothetical protein